MQHQPTSTVIVSTYNWPTALELCLRSIAAQKVMPTEVIIADDGSKPDTKQLIDKIGKTFEIPVRHVWHPDDGFQLSKIRNRAIAAAQGEYIIQIDGDLILHPMFVSDHLSFAEKNHFVTGSRILLKEKATQKILQNKTIHFGFLIRGSKNFFNGLRNKSLGTLLSKHYKIEGKNKYYVKGCNMAFWKADLIRVNGYDESFIGWGKEDSEIAIRLINAGVLKKFIKMAGIVYHLYHKEATREREEENVRLMQQTIAAKGVRANSGLEKYLYPL